MFEPHQIIGSAILAAEALTSWVAHEMPWQSVQDDASWLWRKATSWTVVVEVTVGLWAFAALMAGGHLYVWARCLLAAGGALLLLKFCPWVVKERQKGKRFVPLLIGGSAIAAVTCLELLGVNKLERRSQAIGTPVTTINAGPFTLLLNCQLANFPVTLPPEATIHFLNPDFPEGISTLLAGQAKTKFPRPDSNGVGYKCEFVNYNSEPVINVSAVLKVSNVEAVANGSVMRAGRVLATGDCHVEIPIIERDGKWDFYVFNLDAARFVEVVPPDAVTVEFRDRAGKTEVQLRHSDNFFGKSLLVSALTHAPRSKSPAGIKPAAPSTTTPSALGGIRIASQKQIPSADPNLPFGLQVVITTDAPVHPTSLVITFSGEVGKLYGSPPVSPYTEEQGGIIAAKPSMVLVEWYSPAFEPEQPILLQVLSKNYVQATQVESIPFKFPCPDGYLK